MNVTSINARDEYPGIIRIGYEDGSFVDWLSTDENLMIPGYVYIITYQPGFSVHLFMAYAQGEPPKLLRVEDNRGPEPRDLRDALPLPSFVPAVS